MAEGCCMPEPAPIASASGMRVSIAASVVMAIGRNRLRAASISAWRGGISCDKSLNSDTRKIAISVPIPVIMVMPMMAVMFTRRGHDRGHAPQREHVPVRRTDRQLGELIVVLPLVRREPDAAQV